MYDLFLNSPKEMHNKTFWLISRHSRKPIPFPPSHFCFILSNFQCTMLYLPTKRKMKEVLHKIREKFYSGSGNVKCQGEMKGNPVHYTHLHKGFFDRKTVVSSE